MLMKKKMTRKHSENQVFQVAGMAESLQTVNIIQPVKQLSNPLCRYNRDKPLLTLCQLAHFSLFNASAASEEEQGAKRPGRCGVQRKK